MSTDMIISREHKVVSNDRPWWFDGDSFTQIQRAATLFSSSSLVPKDYQGKGGLANCVIALNMAQRMNADPLMVMQNLYVVHGRPSWSSQFLIACFNQTGRFSPIRYVWTGTEGEDNWGCQAWSTEKVSGERIEGPLVTIDIAKKEGWFSKNGSKWQTIPRLMLMYRAAAWLVRTHAPELAMGIQTVEESQDIDQPAPRLSIGNGSRASQVSAMLGAGNTVAINEHAPGEDESPLGYLSRLRESIAAAASGDAIEQIIATAESYAGGDALSTGDLATLVESANQRMQALADAKANGRLM